MSTPTPERCEHGRTEVETSYADTALIRCLDCGMRRFSSYSQGKQTLGTWHREQVYDYEAHL